MHGILHRPELLPSKGSSTEEKAQNFVQKGIKKKMKFFGRKSFFYLKHFPEWKKKQSRSLVACHLWNANHYGNCAGKGII